MMEEEGNLGGDGDDIDAAISSLKKRESERAPLKQSFFAAGQIGSDKALKALDLANRTGLDAGTILRDMDTVAMKAASPTDRDLDEIVQKAPKLGGWLRDPLNAGALQNDLEALKTLDGMIAAQKRLPLKRRPDDVLLKQAQEFGKERAASEFPLQEQAGKLGPYGMPTMAPYAVTQRYDSQEHMERTLADQEFLRLKSVEDFVSAEGEIGGLEMLGHKFGENPVSGIPFAASVGKMANLGNVIAAANRYDEGNPTKADIRLLDETARIMLAHELRGTGVGAKVVESGLGITEFAGEVMATAGFGAAGKKLALKGVEEAGEGVLKRVLSKFVASAVQLPAAGVTAIPAAVMERMAPKPQLSVDANGNVVYSQTPGEGLSAVPKAVVSRFADQFSAELFGLWSQKVPGATMDMFKKSIAKEGAVEVMKFIGMGEVSQLIKEATFVEPWRVPLPIRAFYDPEAREELAATTIVGFGMGAAGAAKHNLNTRQFRAQMANDNVIKYTEFLQQAGETVKAMEAHQKSPAVVESAIREMVKDSGSEYDYVSAKKFEEVYGRKAKDFAAELTGKPNALEEAQTTGQLQLPKAAVIAKIAAGEQAKLFQGELRPDPMMPTMSEAKKHLAGVMAEMEAERKGSNAEAVQNGDVFLEDGGWGWRVEKNKRGGGYLVQVKPDGTPGATVYELGSKDANRVMSEAKKRPRAVDGAASEKPINPEVGPGDVKDFASIVGKDVAAQAEQAGRPKQEAGMLGKLVESVYRIFGIRGGKQPEQVAEESGPLVQKGEAGALAQPNRGGYTPPDITKSQALIQAFKSADPSTVPHELAHHFLDVIASDPALKEPLFNKFLESRKLTAEKWAEMTLDEKRPHHEAFAEQYEQWLFEGKAPNKELRNAFFKFREMLGQVYDKNRGKGVDIAPEIREVFEKMHATDTEIAEARERLERLEPHLLRAKSIVLDAKSADRIAELMADANRAATERLDAEITAEHKRAQTTQEKEARRVATEQATADVDGRKEQIALAHLERGTKPDGTPLPIEDGPPLKLNREAIKEKWSAAEMSGIPEKAIVDKGGVSPDFAAEEFGFTSGDELIKAISKAEPRAQAIKREVERLMYEHHSENIQDLTEEARKAIHNDSEQKLNLYQMEWVAKNKLPHLKDLIKRLSNPKRHIQEARELAEEAIGKISFREADPRMYERGEVEANRAAAEAITKGDFEGFIGFMERVVLNAELYRAAVASREGAGKVQAKMKKTRGNDFRSEIFTANPEHLGQIDALNDQYSFSNEGVKSVERKRSLREFVESMTEDNYIVQIPDRLLNDAYKTNWKDVPLSQLFEIGDTVDHIAHLAKLKNELIARKEKRELQAVVKENVAEIVANSKGKLEQPIDSYAPEVEKKRNLKELEQEFIKDSTLLREMAGSKDGGSLWENIQRPIDEAGTNEAARIERQGKAWNKAFDIFTKKETLHLFDKVFIPEVNGSLSRMNIMMTGLLYAQEGGAQRFKDGRGWGEAEIKAILSHLTEKEVRWINEMHDVINANKAEVKAQMESATGLPQKMVEGVEVDTPAGKIKGNYAPFKYDNRKDIQSAKQAEKEELKSTYNGSSLQASTKHGFRESRQQGVKRTLRLDFGVLSEHLREVAHDLAYYQPLLDVNRVLRHPDMERAVKDHYGDQTFKHLEGWLNDIATGDKPAVGQFEKKLNWARQGTATAALGWSLMQAITDPIGITQGMRRVGLKWVAKGVSRWLGDATKMENTVKWVNESSEFMRLRSNTWMREVNEIRNQVTGKNQFERYLDFGLDKLTGGKIDLDDLTNSFYWLMSKVQLLQDMPTWLGAYEKSMAEAPKDVSHGARHERAVAMADRAVLDAFGGGQIKDLAPIQKGSAAKKMWTTFYSFASTTLNLAHESKQQFMKDPSFKSAGKFAADLSMLYVIPPLIILMIKEAVGSGDDEPLAKKAAEEIASSFLGSIPGAREVTSGIRGNDYAGPAGARIFGVIGKSIKSTIAGKPDARALNQLGGILFHYPSAQIQRFIDGVVALEEGKTKNPLAPLFGPKRRGTGR